MDVQSKLIYIITDLVLPLVLGYFARRNQYLSEKNCNRMIVFNILVLCTVLSVLSFWNLPLKWELIWLPLFGILLSIIPGIAAYITAGKKYDNSLEKGSYMASAILSNVGILGGLCAYILFGEAAYAYTQMVAMIQNLVLFLFCFPMAQYYRQQAKISEDGLRLTFFSLFFNRNQLPVVGLAVGIMLYLGGVPRPAFMTTAFDWLIHISAWTALIPAGYSIDFSAMRKYYGTILDLIPIKFIATPIVAYLIAIHLFSDPVVLGTILILASVPTGINAIITARLYNLNLHVSGAAFVLTTAIFLFLVYPILFVWLTNRALTY